jgi:hypothetical protein
MINNLTAPVYNLRQIKEEDIDFVSYQVESNIETLFGMMQYLRHNNVELFNQYLYNWKETEAKVLEMGSRIKSMSKMIKLEQAIGGLR